MSVEENNILKSLSLFKIFIHIQQPFEIQFIL